MTMLSQRNYCVAVVVCDVEFGYWVCGESWLAIPTTPVLKAGHSVSCSHVSMAGMLISYQAQCACAPLVIMCVPCCTPIIETTRVPYQLRMRTVCALARGFIASCLRTCSIAYARVSLCARPIYAIHADATAHLKRSSKGNHKIRQAQPYFDCQN